MQPEGGELGAGWGARSASVEWEAAGLQEGCR